MRRIVALLFVLLVAFAWTTSIGAQSAIDFGASEARSDFPNGITFTLAVEGADIDEVRLIYELAPDGVRTTATPDCVGGTSVNCTFQLPANRRNLLIPGAELTYFWRVTSGEVTEESALQRVTYEDDRFEWQQVSDGNLTLWWYEGSEEEAEAVLAAGRESLDGIGALLQTEVDFPVKIFYYASVEDMGPAIISDDDGRGGVVTLGEVVYSDAAMISAESAPEEITRHEIAHIVVRQAIAGPYDVPDWLNEGTAVFAQTEPLSDQRRALERAIESGQVLSVRSLSSATSGALGGRVSLFYGQSWGLVDFLVETYGEDQFAQLFRTFKEGASTADALEQVFGFNQDGLENAWRASVGLPPREAPTPDSEQVPSSQDSATPEPEATPETDKDGSVPLGLIVAVVVLVVLLVGALGIAGMVVARRYG